MFLKKPFVRAVVSLLVIGAALVAFAYFESGIPAEKDQVKIPVLLYHSVSDEPVDTPDYSVDTALFGEQMQYLRENGYTPLYLNEIGRAAQYRKPVVITFDDGYVDNYTNAYPVLEKYDMKATIFVITKYINAGGFLSADEIRRMEDLVSFQSHTVDHVPLSTLNFRQIRYECSESRRALEEITGEPVYALSYPSGMFSADVERVASDFYDCAVSTLPGANDVKGGRYRLRRVYILRSDTMEAFIRKLNLE